MKKYLRYTSGALTAAILSAALCFTLTARAADDSDKMGSKMKTKLTANDKKFVKKAYKGNLTEVAEAKIAKENAKNDATKEVAERMITDHSSANDKLMEIAKEENLDLSKVEAKTVALSDSDFDKGYLEMLKKDHEKDIAMYEKEANDSGAKEDSDVVKYAKNTLPTLKEHLQMVDDAIAKLK